MQLSTMYSSNLLVKKASFEEWGLNFNTISLIQWSKKHKSLKMSNQNTIKYKKKATTTKIQSTTVTDIF